MTESADQVKIDARGLECPVPTQQAVEAMRRAREAGTTETLVVELDDAICAADIPFHANTLGYDADSERSDNQQWTIILRPRGATTTQD